MKKTSVLLILFGLVCLAGIFTGVVALVAPMPAEPTLDSISESVGFVLWIAYAVCGGSLIVGMILFIRRSKKLRQQERQATRAGLRKRITIALVSIVGVAGVLFAIFTYMTRWDPNEAWAAKVIGESGELQILLARYHEANGEFPESLDDIDEDYTKPTDFLSRNADPTGTSRWFYDRIGPNDYQLYATAYSWVSYHDAIVYRKSGTFAEPWFENRDAGDWRDFGKGRYVKGFSRYDERYYFDADGDFHKNGP